MNNRAGFRKDLQGLRGLAVLLVVAFHAEIGAARGGYLGVDVFFVVSGFVITRSTLQRLSEGSGEGAARQFVTRRVRRLFPALAAMIAATTALSLLLLPGPSVNAALRSGLASVISMSNVVFGLSATSNYFSPGAALNPFLHTWSLAVEEQFYALFALGLALAGPYRRWKRRPSPEILLLVGGVASFVLAVALAGRTGAAGRVAFYAPVTRAWQLIAGVGLALHLSRGKPVGPLLRLSRQTTVRVAALLGLLVMSFSYTASTAFPGIAALPVVVATAVLIVPQDDVVRRILSHRILVRVGDISYSLYLWHWPCIVFARAMFPHSDLALILAAVLSFAPAALSYRWFEPTGIRASRWTTARAAAALAMALLALIGHENSGVGVGVIVST